MNHLPLSLLIALIVQFGCQLFKTVIYSIRDGRLGLHYLSTTGGIPSAHSAFVTSLSVSVGMKNGFASDLFSVSAVFSIIVIYDAMRVRGAVEKHAKLLNRLVEKYHPEEEVNLREMIGHTPKEILAGVLTGGIAGFLLTYFVFTG